MERLTGRIVTPDGVPVAGAQVEFVELGATAPLIWRVQDTVANGSGWFVFEDVLR